MAPVSDPLLAVIIPTYNRPARLAEALDSLQAQRYEHWTAIVVDDASDVSYENVQGQFEDEPRIRFIRKSQNEGINASRNRGLERALAMGADFIVFLDDDDVFAANYFQKAVEVIREHPEYGWFMSNNFGESKPSSREIVSDGEMDFIDDYIYRKFRGDKAHLFSRAVLADVRLDERFRSSHRWPFYIQLAGRTKIWAFVHDSVRKQYLEEGITRQSKGRRPRNVHEVVYRFARHWHVIRQRPFKLVAYKYLLMELAKSPRYLLGLLRQKRITSGAG